MSPDCRSQGPRFESSAAALMSFGKTLIYICHTEPMQVMYKFWVPWQDSLKMLERHNGSRVKARVIIWKRHEVSSLADMSAIQEPTIIIIIIRVCSEKSALLILRICLFL